MMAVCPYCGGNVPVESDGRLAPHYNMLLGHSGYDKRTFGVPCGTRPVAVVEIKTKGETR